MMSDLLRTGQKVLLVRSGARATVIRRFKSDDDGPKGFLYVIRRELPDPLTGSRIDTAWRVELSPIDAMQEERERRRMAFELASERNKK
jgi:hypothetical protein